jgi:hypothetical protein
MYADDSAESWCSRILIIFLQSSSTEQLFFVCEKLAVNSELSKKAFQII